MGGHVSLATRPQAKPFGEVEAGDSQVVGFMEHWKNVLPPSVTRNPQKTTSHLLL